MFAPFHNFSATESQGMFIGDGFQDDYVKFILGQNHELSVVGENNGTVVTYIPSTDIGFNPTPTTENLDLFFEVNSATGSVQARYQIDAGQINDLGTPFNLQGDVLTSLQKLLIERIDVASDGISVTLHAAGIRSLVAELADQDASAPSAPEPLLEAAE
jgi:hypothetical protein